LAQAAATAQADIVVGETGDDGAVPGVTHRRILFEPVHPHREGRVRESEWALFTSGTSGAPKMVGHSLRGLTGAMGGVPKGDPGEQVVWATFYDIRRYGGLQMLLRALTGGVSLLLTEAHEPLADFLSRVRGHGVTHLAGTPSHWRRALMSPALAGVSPRYVRLSGEIADQPVLDSLRARFPGAAIGHAYASTEAGVGFEVTDGLAGFPVDYVEREDGPVRMRVMDGTLQIRSGRTAKSYLGEAAPPLGDAEGWVDTGDLVERRGERFHFLGRRSGIINVGGLKISPEEVEAVINACPGVRMSRVVGRASPLLGALVAAEVVLADALSDPAGVRGAILAHCRAALPPHKTPASIRFVDALKVGAAGKLERRVA
jgi:acyl-coenzyme A synthetase/AMP-(fatty) acid ligase